MQIGINSNSLERWFERGVNIFNELAPFCYVLNLVGSGIFFLAMLLGFTDVILRYIFGTPITGAGEAIGLSLVFIVFLGLSYVALNKRHVNIDIIINLLPAKSRTATNIITDILSIGIIGLMLVQSIRYGLIAMGTGAIVSLLHVPTFPFIFVIAFSLILLLAVLLRDFLEDLVSGLKLQFAPWLWVTLFIVTILLIFIAILWLQPGSLEFKPITTGLIGLGVFFILLFSGMPIAYGLFLVSFLFLGHTTNLQAAFALLGAFPFRVVDNYTWAVIALFVIMGYILFFARFGADLFETAYKWIGHFKGGLAIATVGASTAFAAIIGDATSATATMSAAALPEMRKYEYDTALATGCIAAAATLGPMIPPSVSFIVYGLITITSIGSLFISGIFPGIILALLFSLIIYFRCARNPKLGPKGPRYNLRTKLKSLTSAIPVIMLFIVSIGGIYSGVFTPTEGGAVGGTGALILSLIMNRLSFRKIADCLVEAGQLISLVFLIILSSLMFGYFLSAQGIAAAFANYFVTLAIPSWLIIFFICLVHFVLGCIIDPIAMVLITMPIFFPIVTKLGYDPVWFGVLVVLFMNVGLITPPFGINCFTIKGVAPEIPIGTIFRGVYPFVIATILVAILVFVFPKIATFLPNLIQ